MAQFLNILVVAVLGANIVVGFELTFVFCIPRTISYER